MIDLILTKAAEVPVTLFTRNFRVHSGIPLGLYTEGERSTVALAYGDMSMESIRELAPHYQAIIAMPSNGGQEIPEIPSHYETMTVKAPILAEIRSYSFPEFSCFVKTSEGSPLILEGSVGKTLVLVFTADLVRATIRILSGELEQETGLDKFGRHLSLTDNIIYAPAVSFHFNLIENAIRYVHRKLGMLLFSIPRWPQSAPLAIFLSHDVDVVRKWTKKRMAYELFTSSKGMFGKKGVEPLKFTLASIMDAIRGRDPYWNFDELLFMESGNGFKSTWFLAPFGGEFKNRENEIDPVYHRKSSEITAMIRRIIENGCELGFHGTRNAYKDIKAFRRQVASFENRLGFRLCGVRHHYLMFTHGKTLGIASEAGMAYDATLGFGDRTGYRNGIASPFFPYVSSHQAGKLVEIPLNFMDGVFLHAQDGEDAAIRRITESYLYAKAAGGLFSVLVHPGNMDPHEMPPLGRFYQSFLNRCRLDRALSMTGTELARWWTAREQVIKSLECGDQIWRIQGTNIPENMDFSISCPQIKSMRFAIEGGHGTATLDHDTLIIRPGKVDPARGLTVMRKY
ncbi:MAG: hypothetical protein WCU00_06590 [Candidatus Latescibacterota bacterium]